MACYLSSNATYRSTQQLKFTSGPDHFEEEPAHSEADPDHSEADPDHLKQIRIIWSGSGSCSFMQHYFISTKHPKRYSLKIVEEIIKSIPVVILSSSEADIDISYCYQMQANCYINKPHDLFNYMNVVKSISDFWFQTVRLPILSWLIVP